MINTTFATIMVDQLNNPECSFLSGMVLGNMTSGTTLLSLLLIFILWKALDKLAIGPLIDRIKKKLYRKHANKRTRVKS